MVHFQGWIRCFRSFSSDLLTSVWHQQLVHVSELVWQQTIESIFQLQGALPNCFAAPDCTPVGHRPQEREPRAGGSRRSPRGCSGKGAISHRQAASKAKTTSVSSIGSTGSCGLGFIQSGTNGTQLFASSNRKPSLRGTARDFDCFGLGKLAAANAVARRCRRKSVN